MYHCLDVEGDIVLKLRHTKQQFAIWIDEKEGCPDRLSHVEAEQGSSDGGTRKKSKKKRKDKSSLNVNGAVDIPAALHSDSRVVEADPAAMDRTMSEEEQSFLETKAIMASGDESALSTLEDTTQFRVSSRHLILASKHFERVLSSDWQEGRILRNDGQSFIELEDWDPEALLILLNIIHGRTRAVPRIVNLELLTKLAVLVEYYQCLEVVEVFAEMWIAQLMSKPPSSYGRQLVLWIQVCYVFKRPEELKTAVYTALIQSRGPVQTLELPAPVSLAEKIECCREDAIARVLKFLDDLRRQFLEEEACSFECRSILVGALTKEMHRWKLYDPWPEPPFLGLSLTDLFEGLRGFRDPKWRCKESEYEYSRYQNHHQCNLKTYIEPGVKDVQAFLAGFWQESLLK